jgi:hydrogenase nickel incorporation protein HypA/HybF
MFRVHELSIALSIIDIATEESKQRDDAHIEAIHLKIGPLAGIVNEALTSAFQLAAEGTVYADCRLVIEEIPVVAFCLACNAECAVSSLQWFHCSECGAPVSEILHGKELLVSAMELSQ